MSDVPKLIGQAVDARKDYTRTIIEDERPMTGAQFQGVSEILMARVESICLGREREIEAAVAAGVRRALDEALTDEARVKKFWRTGFDELSGHTSDSTSRWIGKRILTIILAAVASAAILLLIKTGAIK